eukprot:9412176-Pyramimonas_sp.AAC.1
MAESAAKSALRGARAELHNSGLDHEWWKLCRHCAVAAAFLGPVAELPPHWRRAPTLPRMNFMLVNLPRGP